MLLDPQTVADFCQAYGIPSWDKLSREEQSSLTPDLIAWGNQYSNQQAAPQVQVTHQVTQIIPSTPDQQLLMVLREAFATMPAIQVMQVMLAAIQEHSTAFNQLANSITTQAQAITQQPQQQVPAQPTQSPPQFSAASFNDQIKGIIERQKAVQAGVIPSQSFGPSSQAPAIQPPSNGQGFLAPRD